MMLILSAGNDRRCTDTARFVDTGFEKTIYENALGVAPRVAGLVVEGRATVSVGYQVVGMNAMDLLVEDRRIIELKAAA